MTSVSIHGHIPFPFGPPEQSVSTTAEASNFPQRILRVCFSNTLCYLAIGVYSVSERVTGVTGTHLQFRDPDSQSTCSVRLVPWVVPPLYDDLVMVFLVLELSPEPSFHTEFRGLDWTGLGLN